MKAVVVGVDTYVWVEDGETRTAEKGETIEVSEAEFNRIEGALAKPGSKDAKAATADADDTSADES